MLTELAQYSTETLSRVLTNPEIMSAMNKKREKRKEALNDYFLAQIFR
jgi:hypothetical protein